MLEDTNSLDGAHVSFLKLATNKLGAVFKSCYVVAADKQRNM